MLRRRRLWQFSAIVTGLCTALYLVAPFLLRSPAALKQNVQDTNTGGLAEFLRSKGLGTDRTLFVTIASQPYAESMVNFKMGLDRFSLGGDYVVLCLDVPCLETARNHDIVAFGGYLMNETEPAGDWHYPVARAMLAANLALIEDGYNFVFLDGDVYLTGTRHPLSAMLPLSDPSWDIQYQNNSHSRGNIGWYWARPTPLVYDFFVRSERLWNETHQWDQASMNLVVWQMTNDGSELAAPNIVLLNLKDYQSTMLFPWEDVYANSAAIEEMNREAVMVHYTMLSNTTKLILAKHFGHWFIEKYYTLSPRLLRPINIYGTKLEIQQKIDFSVHLAKTSGRTFMWPIMIHQKDSQRSTVWKAIPAIRVADVDRIATIVPWVEGTYLENRRKYHVADLDSVTIRAPAKLTDLESVTSVTRRCVISTADIVTIDFGA